jgi:hypothetical protein
MRNPKAFHIGSLMGFPIVLKENENLRIFPDSDSTSPDGYTILHESDEV